MLEQFINCIYICIFSLIVFRSNKSIFVQGSGQSGSGSRVIGEPPLNFGSPAANSQSSQHLDEIYRQILKKFKEAETVFEEVHVYST